MIFDWVRWSFGEDDEEGIEEGGLIPFDVNWDMDGKCFVPEGGLVVLDEVPFTDQSFTLSVGSVTPDSFDTTTLLASWSVASTDSFNHIINMTMLRQCYLSKGFCGWRILSDKPQMVSGRILLYGKLVECDSMIMAQVTFDYSSLIEVGTAASIAAQRKQGL